MTKELKNGLQLANKIIPLSKFGGNRVGIECNAAFLSRF